MWRRASWRLLFCLLLVPSLGFEWPGRIYRVTRELAHADPTERRQLVRQLGGYPAESVKEPLLLALEDSDSSVRLEAADVAGHVRLRQAVPILLDWLDDKEADTRRRAAEALGGIGETRALPSLVRALGDSSSEVRKAAVVALSRMATPDTVVPLLGRLEDTDLSVRIEALAGLATQRDARAVVPVLNAAADPAAEVRGAAFVTLGRIGDERALPSLARGLTDEVENARLSAAAALGQLKNRGAVRALKQALERADTRLGQVIVAALANIDDDSARQVLVAELAIPSLQKAAARALVQQARGPLVLPAAPAATSSAPVDRANRAEPILVALTALLRGANPEAKLASAEALAQIAEVAPIDAVLPALISTLTQANGELAVALMDALASSAAPDALLPLLERLGQSQGDALSPVLAALTKYFELAPPDGRAADPLLGRLAEVSPAQRVAIVSLLGRVGAPRALPALLPLLAEKTPALRIAAARALGDIGDAGAGPGLLPLLDAEDVETRFTAARALRATADFNVVQQLLSRLRSESTADNHALLIAFGGALGRLSRGAAPPAALTQAALATIADLIAGDDDELADRALDALAVWAPPHAVAVVARSLRLPSSRRRAAAAYALAQLGDPEGRALLRYLLQHGAMREGAAAASALGEIGDQRDVAALVKAQRRLHWPVPGAAAYALFRMAERGVLKPHSAARELCALGDLREPYVRSNVAAALAALGAGPCDEGPNPLDWLEPVHAVSVRAAAARWARAAVLAGKLDAARAQAALERCAQSDLESDVRAACAGVTTPKAHAATDIYAHGPDGVSLKRDALVALRLPNGAVFLGYTDHNAHVRLIAAPNGDVKLEAPGLVALEPPG
jgi:HEAT repeat protein